MSKKIYSPQNDPDYQSPFIDEDRQEVRTMADGKEIPYRFLHGGFRGTNVKFLFCFPLRESYEGRFFQHLSPFPGPDEELASLKKTGENDPIGFALAHGSCFVESNMGSGAVFGKESDPTVFYKASAAVAEYCRKVACELYGEHRVYGYVYGGSGGGYKTMSCIENTSAFDGAVPFVIGSPMSLPNCLTIGAHGVRLLRRCWRRIADALEPGGSGDIYQGLNEEERDALRELVLIGCPPRMCVTFGGSDDGSLPVLAPVVKAMDPAYFTDFWTKPGYLGTEQNGSAVRDRICLDTKVLGVGILSEVDEAAGAGPDGRNGTDDAWQKMLKDGGNVYIEVEQVPEGEDLYLKGVDITFPGSEAGEKHLRLGRIEGNRLIPGMTYGADDIREVLDAIKPGDKVHLDNSDYIAIQTYHRHQVPEDRSFHAWDQYRGEDGTPIYPQRERVISFGFTYGGCGSVQDGEIQGKVIVMNNLMDGDFPWQADWYRRKVEAVQGDQKAKEMFRILYNDNCPHGDVSETGEELYFTSYLGALNQTLLDLAAWTEKGILPAENTGYRMIDNQIILEEGAEKRQGIQATADLTIEGERRKRVKVGEKVSFTVSVEVPEKGGQLTDTEWSFEGEQDFPVKGGEVIQEVAVDGIRGYKVKQTHTFAKPGRYFGVVRVTNNRMPGDDYTRIRNLARVQVIVEDE